MGANFKLKLSAVKKLVCGGCLGSLRSYQGVAEVGANFVA